MKEEVTDLTRGVYRRLYAGFIKGQRINKLSLQAEAWFWRVLTTVDDFGNGEADPELCRAATVGRRTNIAKTQIAKWLDEMAAVNLISFYWVKGEKYLNVVKFESWQPAGKNGRRIKRFPGPEEATGNPGESKVIQVNPGVVSASENTNDNHNHNNNENKNTSLVEQARLVFGFWQEHLNHSKAKLDDKREKAIKGRLKNGYSVDDLCAAIRGCKLTPWNMGKNDRNQVYDDIELICRDAEHVDRFIATARAPGSAAFRTPTLKEQLEVGVVH